MGGKVTRSRGSLSREMPVLWRKQETQGRPPAKALRILFCKQLWITEGRVVLCHVPSLHVVTRSAGALLQLVFPLVPEDVAGDDREPGLDHGPELRAAPADGQLPPAVPGAGGSLPRPRFCGSRAGRPGAAASSAVPGAGWCVAARLCAARLCVTMSGVASCLSGLPV